MLLVIIDDARFIRDNGVIVFWIGRWVVIEGLGVLLRECKGGEGEDDEMNLLMLGISFEDENEVVKELKEVDVVLFDVVPI